MDVILEVIRNCGILHREHDERHDSDTCEHNPRLVQKEVFEVLEHVVVLFFRLRDSFTGREERDEEESDAQYAEKADRVLVTLRLVYHAVITDSAEPFDEIERCAGDDELTDIRCDETVGIQSRTLVRIVRHDRGKRTIRQVDESVRRSQ